MPFIKLYDDVAIGEIEVDGRWEGALRCYTFPSDLTFVETEGGSELRTEELVPGHLNVSRVRTWQLSADQVNALGIFCSSQFMAASPGELLARIECSTKIAIGELEVWNDRARIDEEHPPYDRIVARLREVESALVELRKGLSDKDKHIGG